MEKAQKRRFLEKFKCFSDEISSKYGKCLIITNFVEKFRGKLLQI